MWSRLAVEMMTIACNTAVDCEEKLTHSHAACENADMSPCFQLTLSLYRDNHCWARLGGLKWMVDIVPDQSRRLTGASKRRNHITDATMVALTCKQSDIAARVNLPHLHNFWGLHRAGRSTSRPAAIERQHVVYTLSNQ